MRRGLYFTASLGYVVGVNYSLLCTRWKTRADRNLLELDADGHLMYVVQVLRCKVQKLPSFLQDESRKELKA